MLVCHTCPAAHGAVRPVSLNPPMDFQIDLVSDVTCLNTVQAVLAVARILL